MLSFYNVDFNFICEDIDVNKGMVQQINGSESAWNVFWICLDLQATDQIFFKALGDWVIEITIETDIVWYN